MQDPANVSADPQAATPAGPPIDYATPDVPSHGLADELRGLEQTANGMPITVQKLLDTLEDRGHAVVILLLTAPFVVLPVPGLSTVVGLAVMGLSIGVLFKSRAWMPAFIRRRELSPETLHKLVSGTTRTLGKLERFVKPRMRWLSGPGWHWLIGISLIAANVAFALPGPPGNNIPPAIAMVFLSLGLLERDGLLVLIGHILTWLIWIAIVTLVILFWGAVDQYVTDAFGRVAAKFR